MKKSNRYLAKRLNQLNRIAFCGFSEKQIQRMLPVKMFYDKECYINSTDDNCVYRAVINETISPFNSISRIKFNPNPSYISRANLKRQAIAYYTLGASHQDGIDVSIIEACHDRLKTTNLRYFELTVSKWKIKKNIPIQIVCYDKIAQVSGTDLIKYFNELRFGKKESMSRNKYRSWLLKMRFIANQFAKEKILCEKDYYISAWYSYNILKKTEIKGIIYPSVQYFYKGFNIALHPDLFNISNPSFELEEVFHYAVQFDNEDIRTYPKFKLINSTIKFIGDKIVW